MAGQYRLDFCLVGSTGGAATFYIVAPVDLKVLGVQASNSGDHTGVETITLSENSQDIGVLTFVTGATAGATGTYAADATYGTKTVNAGDVIQVVITQLAADSTYCGYIDFDPYCR